MTYTLSDFGITNQMTFDIEVIDTGLCPMPAPAPAPAPSPSPSPSPTPIL